MKPQFYATFWQLTLYDIFIPTDQYNTEISRLTTQARSFDNDRTPQTSSMITKRKKDRERLYGAVNRLKSDLARQEVNHEAVRVWLKREGQHWFQDCKW